MLAVNALLSRDDVLAGSASEGERDVVEEVRCLPEREGTHLRLRRIRTLGDKGVFRTEALCQVLSQGAEERRAGFFRRPLGESPQLVLGLLSSGDVARDRQKPV